MANFDGCIPEIEDKLGRKLTEDERDEVDELGGKAKDLVRRFQDKDALEGGIVDETTKEKLDAYRTQKDAALNATVQQLIWDKFMHGFSDKPELHTDSMMGKAEINQPGAYGGVGRKIATLRDYYVSQISARLQKDNLFKFVADPKNDRNIALATSELEMDKPDPERLKSFGAEAVATAQHIKDVRDMSVAKANDAGANIDKLEGYMTKQDYDPVKMSKFGGAQAGDPANREAWKDFIKTNAKGAIQKNFGDLNPTELDNRLNAIYGRLSNGYHLKFNESEGGSPSGFMSGSKNVGKSLGEEKLFQFDTPEAAYEYYSKTTNSANFMEGVVNQLRRTARDTAIMQQFGPNAESNYRAVADKIMKYYNANGQDDLATRFKADFDQTMRTEWPQMTGEASIPVNGKTLDISQTIKAVNSSRYLGSVNLAQLGHLMYAALTTRRFNNQDTGDLMRGMTQVVRGIMSSTSGPEMAQRAASNGIAFERMLNPFAAYGEDDFHLPGALSKLVQLSLKLQGVAHIRDATKMAASDGLNSEIASQAHLPFNELPVGKQQLFNKFSVTPEEWEIARKSEMNTNSTWGKLFSPDNVGVGAENEIKNEIARQRAETGITRDVTDRDVAKFQDTLQFKFRNISNEVASLATAEPTLQDRAFINRGTQPGTAEGELYRQVGFLKSFTKSVWTNHMDAELRGYSSDDLSIPEALRQIMSHPTGSAAGGIASIVGMALPVGYGIASLKGLTQLKAPRYPQNAEDLADIASSSMLHSMGAGIYGDFFFGKVNRFGGSPTETAIGPLAQNFDDATKLFRSAFNKSKGYAFENQKEEQAPFAPTALKFGLNYTPGVNTLYNNFYTHAALDYLVVNRMYDWANPGYLRRMEKAVNSEQGQNYLVSPGNYLGK